MQVHDRPQGASVLVLAGDSVSVKRMQNHAPYAAWLNSGKIAGFKGFSDGLLRGQYYTFYSRNSGFLRVYIFHDYNPAKPRQA